jgi:6-phosphogluconate dehydrogenase
MQKELIFIGLGRMGRGMAEHLTENGYFVHGFDVSEEMRREAAQVGIPVHETLTEAIAAMADRKVIWLMVPSKFVDGVLDEVIPQLSPNDIVIDGGNTFFKDTLRRGEALKAKEIHFVDCGTSGGMRGARHGASLMVGGPDAVIKEIEHIFHTLAAPNAYAHLGKTGAGHFVKMVHNGIEYGMMGALAEGMSYIEDHQAEFDIRINEVFKPYQHGSVIESSLVNWLADSYLTEGYLESIAGEVPRGETEEEMEYIITAGKTPVLEASVVQRKATRGNPSRIGTLLSAMRNQFGGHAVVKREGK